MQSGINRNEYDSLFGNLVIETVTESVVLRHARKGSSCSEAS